MLKLSFDTLSRTASRQIPTNVIRSFSGSAYVFAKAAPKLKDGKKKAKQGFKNKGAESKTAKVKKGGMTHLKFKDAVRSLKFEKSATDFSQLNIKDISYQSLKSITSTVVKYNDYTEKVLQDLDSFKKYQYHELFSKPVSMVSDNTLKLDEQFISKLESPSKDNRLCLLGEKGVGKSVLLSQAKALAISKYNKEVILLHLDHPQKIVEGSSDYVYNKRIEKYQQPIFTKRWVKKLRAANEEVFKKLPLTRDISFTAKKKEYNLKKEENTLYDFILYNHDFGKVGPTSAFNFLIEEIMHHSKKVPVLVSIDDFNTLTSETLTKYRHPDFESIHFTEFEMGSFILKLASGELSFAKGGVLLAESKDISYGHTLPVGLGLEQYDPYYKQHQCDFEVANSLLLNGGVSSMTVENLTKNQCRELYNFWDATGVLRVREYPSNEDYKTSEQIADEQAAKRSGEDEEKYVYDSEEQFENLVQNNFTISSGNPGHLIKTTTLSY
ncbi:unnamed protein product [Debaryomyces tyrocola]|nr:unnamed protein product [Debaryomyces tyrocola]